MKILKCSICGKVVEVVSDTDAKSVCCGKEMQELIPGTSDGAVEKHVPIVEISESAVTVTVGEVEHPMLDAHYIEWIAVVTKEGTQRKYLKPGDTPKAEFRLTETDQFESAYAYCNLHGLWKSK
jgi:superoxide reductase